MSADVTDAQRYTAWPRSRAVAQLTETKLTPCSPKCDLSFSVYGSTMTSFAEQ
jgi:hypothetical protein